MMKTIRTSRGRNTTKITNLWKGLKFMYHDHTQFCGKIPKKKKKKKRASNKTSITDINIVSISEVVPRLN